MMLVLAIVLAIAALTVASWVLFGLLDTIPIPMACPRCRASLPRQSSQQWHERDRNGLLRCRACKASFSRHPDGSLIEDS